MIPTRQSRFIYASVVCVSERPISDVKFNFEAFETILRLIASLVLEILAKTCDKPCEIRQI